ncbi:sulfurtransferase [Caryophanon latum]|uniref:Thiosulfate sulfurtransferase n=1 Tax=Caryophanon latum TaxID=33977 RepID=A0A1C0YPW2_9BACL|nr:rhodanese-like domain-containing protein [Caryophanon latum]OCS89214.1 thiosulfate sulfurtransferase [Caryophanon latum]
MTNIPPIVTGDWLEEQLQNPALRLLDATTFLKIPEGAGYPELWSGREAYKEEHIPGAAYADLLHDFTDPNGTAPFTIATREQFLAAIEQFGITKDTFVVIYDRGPLVNVDVLASDWSARLRWQLKYEGFDNVAVLDGGFRKWKLDGRQTVSGENDYEAAPWTFERRPQLIVTKEDVKAAMHDDNIILINSLSEADFRGETNTYPRKGHIPGSQNVFFGSHSSPETRLLNSDDVLRDTFNKIGALDPNKKVITYCGGGIAATWNALLLNKLGQENVAVYDGSLNEWASDDSCPLVTL